MTTTLALILIIVGGLLFVLGILYVTKPDIFQQGFWRSIDISRLISTPEENSGFVKRFGGILIVVGLIVFIIGMFT
ncbi:MAG: hypothetical protein P1P76_07800 [Anaerolineales bacterium]|nr:hypothetical protein [Anaerolineales bacterium]